MSLKTKESQNTKDHPSAVKCSDHHSPQQNHHNQPNRKQNLINPNLLQMKILRRAWNTNHPTHHVHVYIKLIYMKIKCIKFPIDLVRWC